jgi:hypothetical protein
MKNSEIFKFKRHLEAGVLGIALLIVGSIVLLYVLLDLPIAQHSREFIVGILIFSFGFFLTFFVPIFTIFELQSQKIYRWRGLLPFFKKKYYFNEIKSIKILKSRKLFFRDVEVTDELSPIGQRSTFEVQLKIQDKTLLISNYKLSKSRLAEKIKPIQESFSLLCSGKPCD